MPTFKAYKNGQVIDEFTGAVPAKLTVSTAVFGVSSKRAASTGPKTRPSSAGKLPQPLRSGFRASAGHQPPSAI